MLKTLIAITLLFGSSQLIAQEIEGVDIPEYVTLLDPGNHIELNGAGLNTNSRLSTHIVALYLKKKSSNVDAILSMPGSKRVFMHFLHDQVEKEDLIKTWADGFKNNHSAEQFSALKARLEKFSTLFRAVKKGEVILLDYLPNIGTEVQINDDLIGLIQGKDFYQALLKVWLGSSPVDDRLKKTMLGLSGK